MIKDTLRDTLRKLAKKIDFEILAYTVLMVVLLYLAFWFLSIDVENVQIEETRYIEQSNKRSLIEPKAAIVQNDCVELDIDDAQLLMKLAWSEAGNQGIEGQLAIMNVVMNRVNDENFPNTVKGVIYQKLGDCYQFSVAGNGVLNKAQPTEETHQALAELEGGRDISQGALFFEAMSSGNSWHKRNKEFIFEDYGQRFYK